MKEYVCNKLGTIFIIHGFYNGVDSIKVTLKIILGIIVFKLHLVNSNLEYVLLSSN